jgi:hypothetical protein
MVSGYGFGDRGWLVVTGAPGAFAPVPAGVEGGIALPGAACGAAAAAPAESVLAAGVLAGAVMGTWSAPPCASLGLSVTAVSFPLFVAPAPAPPFVPSAARFDPWHAAPPTSRTASATAGTLVFPGIGPPSPPCSFRHPRAGRGRSRGPQFTVQPAHAFPGAGDSTDGIELRCPMRARRVA